MKPTPPLNTTPVDESGLKTSAMNTPSNAGNEPGKNLEYRKCLSCDEHWDVTHESTNICPVCGSKANVYMSEFIPDRIRTTPPTQSQEGETPEIDYPCIVNGKHLSALVMCMDAILRKPEDERRKESYQKLRSMVLSENENGGIAHKHLERRLTAAQRENDRLRKLIEDDASHATYCEVFSVFGKPCNCWKARAATEEGKRG